MLLEICAAGVCVGQCTSASVTLSFQCGTLLFQSAYSESLTMECIKKKKKLSSRRICFGSFISLNFAEAMLYVYACAVLCEVDVLQSTWKKKVYSFYTLTKT